MSGIGSVDEKLSVSDKIIVSVLMEQPSNKTDVRILTSKSCQSQGFSVKSCVVIKGQEKVEQMKTALNGLVFCFVYSDDTWRESRVTHVYRTGRLDWTFGLNTITVADKHQ